MLPSGTSASAAEIRNHGAQAIISLKIAGGAIIGIVDET